MLAAVQDLIDRFRRDGFVHVPALIDTAEIDRFAPLVDAAVRARKANDPRTLAEKSRYEQSFLQCINLWEDFPELRPLVFHPRVCETAARLLGVSAIRLWHDQALYKEPGGRETDAHQDQPYWPIAEADTVTAWIPLVDVDETVGCMGYVPGSHAVGLRRFVNIFFGEPERVTERPELAGREPVFVPARRGDVLFHHGLTVHLAHPNRSATMRRVQTAIYFRDGCTRAPHGIHQSVDRQHIRPGEPIVGDATPIAWPRAPGDWPPAPTSLIDPTSLGHQVWPPSAIAARV
jgi:ectoine hydroxylase-related dioxygenase (phytanoyl-CoA dioxygenase family)